MIRFTVLKTVDLKDTGKKKASQFSMGMKQRLGIAIALLNQPGSSAVITSVGGIVRLELILTGIGLFLFLAGGMLWFSRWEGREVSE